MPPPVLEETMDRVLVPDVPRVVASPVSSVLHEDADKPEDGTCTLGRLGGLPLAGLGGLPLGGLPLAGLVLPVFE